MLTLQWIENTFNLTALWMLEEAGAPYQLSESFANSAKACEDRAASKDVAVYYAPILRDADVKLTNLAAICVYIAERFPDTELAPSIEDPLRRKYFHWLFYCYACMAPCVTNGEATHAPFYHFQRASYSRLLASFRSLGETGCWIIGDRFSSADVMLGSILLLGRERFGPPIDAAWEPAYVQKCLERPALRRAMSIAEAI